MPETETTTNKTTILPHQKSQFDRMCAVARGCLNTNRSALGVKLRANFLLIGPSGSGKTFLASALAAEMQVPFLSISIADWILLGGSHNGCLPTWPAILKFVEQSANRHGSIIFIDELDKCYHDSNYNAFLRTEVFSLCDSKIPMGLKDADDNPIDESRLAKARDFLANRTMILAGGAFQDIWERKSAPSIGFLAEDSTEALPDPADLIKILPVEMINRFASELFILPPLSGNDYRLMVDTVAMQVPEIWRKRFLELGHTGIPNAVRYKKGARYMEEVLLSTIVEERGSLANFVPPPKGIEPSNTNIR